MGAIEEAKAVISAHEGLFAAGDIDGVMSNMDEDVTVLAADCPPAEGHEAVRSLYESLLALGSWEFSHDYSPATVVADLVVLHGVARGSLTQDGAQSVAFANNFLIVMRRGTDGQYRAWRASFAPSGEGGAAQV